MAPYKNDEARLLMLPGMGATSQMYGPPWGSLRQAKFINWPQGEFADLGAVATELIVRYAINSGDLIGGSSLGGMVAQEIAARAGCRGVVLVGTAVHGRDVARLLRWMAPLAKGLPVELLQFSASVSGPLGRQFQESDPAFIRSMSLAAPMWTGAHFDARRFRIHGARDHVIPCPAHGVEVIEGAGHLVAMTHAQLCVERIGRWLASE